MRLADPRTKVRIQPDPSAERKIFLMVMDYIEGTDVRVFHNDHVKRDLLLPVPLAAFVVSLLATVYPARQAARVRPAEALRYE